MIDSKFEIISTGSRNAQGLYYDKSKDVILNTEHGPTGGDEVNVNVNPSTEFIENFGWPNASYAFSANEITGKEYGLLIHQVLIKIWFRNSKIFYVIYWYQ